MAQGETQLTVIGNLTADAELRYTQAGLAVANFTIASTPREFDKASNEWKDGQALFLRCSAWRDLAENVTGSLTKGSRVIAVGRLKQRSYDTKEGEHRTVIEMDVDEIGPSLRFATVSVQRSQTSRTQQDNRQRTQTGTDGATPADDVWNAPGYDDETPF
jgi:single-strand DNA-binding protein